MAVCLQIYATYLDSVWSQRMDETPMTSIQFAIVPSGACVSPIDPKYRMCSLPFPLDDFTMPSVGKMICCMQFESGKDAGPEYNKVTGVAYKTIRYGKKFVNKNPDHTVKLTKKDLGNDDWETYQNLDEELVWRLGDTRNRYILEILSKKVDPIETFRNYETCELYIYKPYKINFHMDIETSEKVDEIFKAGKGFIEIPDNILYAMGAINAEELARREAEKASAKKPASNSKPTITNESSQEDKVEDLALRDTEKLMDKLTIENKPAEESSREDNVEPVGNLRFPTTLPSNSVEPFKKAFTENKVEQQKN